jgi:hypothetical protein
MEQWAEAARLPGLGWCRQSEQHNWPEMGLAMCLNSFGSNPGRFGRSALLEIAKLF